MFLPKLTNVQFHPAYTIDKGGTVSVFQPAMTALDTEGRVWRTWQSPETGWQPWEAVMAFVDPLAN